MKIEPPKEEPRHLQIQVHNNIDLNMDRIFWVLIDVAAAVFFAAAILSSATDKNWGSAFLFTALLAIVVWRRS